MHTRKLIRAVVSKKLSQIKDNDNVPDVYPAIDTDLARDNLENDLPMCDRNDI